MDLGFSRDVGVLPQAPLKGSKSCCCLTNSGVDFCCGRYFPLLYHCSQVFELLNLLDFVTLEMNDGQWSICWQYFCLIRIDFLIMASITMLKRRREATSDIGVSGGSIGGGFSEGPWGGTWLYKPSKNYLHHCRRSAADRTKVLSAFRILLFTDFAFPLSLRRVR